MLSKNRKFNIAGTTFYSGRVRIGSLVNFALEPKNIEDKNSIQILNSNLKIIGYFPKELAEEVQSFINGKYPYYCAKVVGIWRIPDGEHEGKAVPKVLAHFANKVSELPFKVAEWAQPNLIERSPQQSGEKIVD
jgi:hypothetical protein